MRQVLSLLSYRGRFHTTKSLLYLAKWPSSERSSSCPRPASWDNPSWPPFFLLSHQGWAEPPGTNGDPQSNGRFHPVEIPSPAGGFSPSSSEGPEVGSSLSATSKPSGGHQHDMAAVTGVPLRSAVQAEIGLLGTVSPLGGKHRNEEWAYTRILLSREPSGSHQQSICMAPKHLKAELIRIFFFHLV